VKKLLVLHPKKWNSIRKWVIRMVWIKRSVCKGLAFMN